jgi:Ca-activated chloride channel family protein
MTWERPLVLHLLWLLPFIIAGMVWAHRVRVRDLGKLLGARLLARSVGEGLAMRRAVQAALWVAALALSVVALAMPQAGADWRPLESEQAHVVLALDLSRSMNAQDVLPSRLERARRDALGLIDVLPGDRVGLVIFAAGAHPKAPLTTDRKVLSMMLAQARTETLRAQGSSIAAALRQSLDLLPEKGAGAQAIVLITDGEDHRPKALEQAVAQVQRREIPVFVLAVGTPEGAPIPLSSGDFKRGPDGQVVLTHLNSDTLEAVARATGGSYTQSVPGDRDSLSLARDIEQALTRQLGVVEQERIPRQVFQVPLGLALLLALLATAMRDLPRFHLPRLNASRSPKLSPLAAALVLLLPLGAKAQDPELMELLGREQYTAALSRVEGELAEDPQNLDLLWVQAEALYGLGQYESSAQVYGQIGAGARHRATRETARLNAARAYYQAGKLEQALEQSQAVLLEDQEQPQALGNVEQLTQEIAARSAPPPPEEQEQEGEEQQEQSGEGESPEAEPQEGEGEEQPQPQEGEGQGQGEEQDPGASPEPGEQPDPGPEGQGENEDQDQDTGISEQAEGQSGEGQASQDDGLLDARPEEGEGEAETQPEEPGSQQEEGEPEGEEGLSQPVAQGEPGDDDTPAEAAAREVLESVEEGSPRASYGGKGGGRDW